MSFLLVEPYRTWSIGVNTHAVFARGGLQRTVQCPRDGSETPGDALSRHSDC